MIKKGAMRRDIDQLPMSVLVVKLYYSSSMYILYIFDDHLGLCAHLHFRGRYY
jgi:hypothetical protein